MNTIKRLYKYLEILEDLPKEKKTVSSKELAKLASVTPTTVRQDFFSRLNLKGKAKIGYEKESLRQELLGILGLKGKTKVIVLGANGLAETLLTNKNKNIVFSAFFEEDKHPLIGKFFHGITVFPLSQIDEYLEQNMNIKIAIITFNPENIKDLFEKIIYGGIKFIWNFSKTFLDEKEGIFVINEYLTGALYELIYEYNKSIKKGGKMEIMVCVGSSCHLKGSEIIIKKLQDYLENNKAKAKLVLKGGFCMGQCSEDGITIKFSDRYYKVTPENIDEFILKKIKPQLAQR
jgi:NADH/NAD ratio-sensing transcriptional regulator Rex